MSGFANQSRKSSHLCMKQYILKILIYLVKDDCSDELSTMHFTCHNTVDFAEITKVDIKIDKNPYALKNKKKDIKTWENALETEKTYIYKEETLIPEWQKMIHQKDQKGIHAILNILPIKLLRLSPSITYSVL